MKQEQSHAYASACYHGEYASCSYACPFRVDVRSFLSNIRKGSFQAAYRILTDTMLFPGMVTELCEEPCRKHCVRRQNDQALSILEVEKACVRLERIQNEAIEFHFNQTVENMSELNCDAVYIATGKNGKDFGLLDGFDDKTLGTNESRCFMRGMLTGVSILDSLEHGMRASKQIEKFLLTGEVHDYAEEYPYENCERLIL